MSVDISRRQYLLLKMFRKDNASLKALNDKQLEDCEYLIDCGYLKATRELVYCDSTIGGARPVPTITAFSTTASGRAAMYTFKATFYKWWIPVIISIGSLVVSIIALLT